jgi:hypothetical protein
MSRGRKPHNAQTDKRGDVGTDPAKDGRKTDEPKTVEGTQASQPNPYVDPNQADIDHYQREDAEARKEFARQHEKATKQD